MEDKPVSADHDKPSSGSPKRSSMEVNCGMGDWCSQQEA